MHDVHFENMQAQLLFYQKLKLEKRYQFLVVVVQLCMVQVQIYV